MPLDVITLGETMVSRGLLASTHLRDALLRHTSESLFALAADPSETATVFTPTSDRNAKEEFTPIDARAVLNKVAQLPITEWRYKTQTDARHIGPMAQDFREAFGLGRDDKHITSVDADGVALAAIQGLNQKLESTLAALFRAELVHRASVEITHLSKFFSQRRLEREIDLSQGYLCRLRYGDGVPSVALISLLALLSAEPSRLEELRRYWALPLAPEPRVCRRRQGP